MKKHVGTGCALNSDGGSKGDGLHDGGLSASPWGKAARRLSEEDHKVFHASVDHSTKQYSRFSVIEVPEDAIGFENVPRGGISGKKRIRMTVTVNHAERYHKELKRHIPADVNLATYEADPELWLMNAAWRCRVSGDPFKKLGAFLNGDTRDRRKKRKLHIARHLFSFALRACAVIQEAHA